MSEILSVQQDVLPGASDFDAVILTIAGDGYKLLDKFERASNLDRLTYSGPTTLIPPKESWIPWKQPVFEKGLFAKEDISEGTLIGAYEGTVVTADFVERECRRGFPYVIWDTTQNEFNGAKPGVLGDNALRYANHVGEGNMLVIDFKFYAERDIDEGEELSWCYGKIYDDKMEYILNV